MKTVWGWPLNHWLAILLPSIERLQLNSRGPFSPESDNEQRLPRSIRARHRADATDMCPYRSVSPSISVERDYEDLGSLMVVG
jgi:hypothetical protein